jgi:multicomponent Na+:H+ antiporter subunit D
MEALTFPLLLGLPLCTVVAMAWQHRRPRARAWLLFGLALANATTVLFAPFVPSYEAGGWQPALGIELGLDALTGLFLSINATVFIAAAIYHLGQERAEGAFGELTYQLVFPVLLMSLNGLFVTRDFFNFYVFFELLAMASYLLVAKGHHRPFEAALKYAVLSILASTMLLAGTAFVYGLSGSLNMSDVQSRLAPDSALWLAPFFLFAFFLKGSLFPLHVWQPDAHAAATTPGSMILAGCLINVGIYGLVRFWPILFGDNLRWVLLLVGTASIVFGAVAAAGTKDAKRLLGYSSTSQLGFVLLGLGWGTRTAIAAALFYLGAHAIAKALLFAITGILGERSHTTSLMTLTGSGVRLPWLNAAYFLGFLSLAGLPPAAGFVAKVSLLRAGLGAGAWPWVGAAVLGTVLTLVYGLRAYQRLFWARRPSSTRAVGPAFGGGLAVALLAALLVLLLVAGEPALTLADGAAKASLNLGGLP